MVGGGSPLVIAALFAGIAIRIGEVCEATIVSMLRIHAVGPACSWSKIYRISECATIEPAGRDLGNTRPMRASRTDLTDATAGDGFRWLRPRDVRSDNAGRRPPEMRRSCQPKAVGCGGSPDNLCLVTDAFCYCDNSENIKTRLDVSAPH